MGCVGGAVDAHTVLRIRTPPHRGRSDGALGVANVAAFLGGRHAWRPKTLPLGVITATLAAGLTLYAFFGLFGYYYVAALLDWPRDHALVAAGTEWAVLVVSLSLIGLAGIIRLSGSSQYMLRGVLLAALCGLGLLTFEFSPELGAAWHATLSLNWILIGAATWPGRSAEAKTRAGRPPVAAKP